MLRCSIVLSGVVLASLAGGCAETKRCFHQCYEPALDGFGDSCAIIEDQTEAECQAMTCDEGRQGRHSWGKPPIEWCPRVLERMGPAKGSK